MDDVLETTVLSPREWMSQARAHQVRAVAFTEDHLKRRQAQIKHPVYDFLFEYYPGPALDPADVAPGARGQDPSRRTPRRVAGLYAYRRFPGHR